MPEPTTVNRALIVPNTGDLAGTWGSAALNPDFVAIDGMLGGFTTISLTNANVTLTVPAGFTATPSAGPTQSQNAIITFTGTLTGNCTITFPMPGFYIVENLCTVGAFRITLASVAPGNVVCAPPGEATHIYCNGVDVKYVDLGRVGSYLDLAVTAVPAWITGCTVPPYLNCDGSTFSAVTYPALNAYLGGTTLPDARGRSRFALDQSQNRITTAGSGLDGTTLLASGGNQLTQQHTHTASSVVTDPGHSHTVHGSSSYSGGAGIAQAPAPNVIPGLDSSTTGISVATTNTSYGSGNSQNMPPAYVGGLTLIRAA